MLWVPVETKQRIRGSGLVMREQEDEDEDGHQNWDG
jgi:hypothetical protein